VRAQAAQTRQLASKLVFEYYKGVEPLAGAIPIRKRMLEDASEYLDRIAANTPRDVDVAVEAGAGFRKLADALYNGRGTANLGDQAGAVRANLRARQLLEGALSQAPNHRQANVEMGKFDIDMGSFEAENGKMEDAEKLYQAGISRLQARLARDPKDSEAAYEVVRGYGVYASMQVKRKISALPQLAKADEALVYLKSVATDATAIGNAEMLIVSTKGNDATQRGDGEAAVRYADDRINLLHRLEKERVNDNTVQSHLFTAYSGKGVILINAKRPREALAPLAEAIRRQGEFLAANPKDANQLGTMGRTYFVRARAHLDVGDREAALKDYLESKSHFARTESLDLPPPLRRMHAQALEALGKLARELVREDLLAAARRDTVAHAARYPQVYEAESLKAWLAEASATR
jgi:tetratricopeptide (TPR) repeat protein